MTVIDEILICANKLANAGTKPTVALVKGKLTQRAPLAVIISTLKNWQHQPDFIAPAIYEEQDVNDDLSTELTELKKELAEMKLLINNLGEQLTKKQ